MQDAQNEDIEISEVFKFLWDQRILILTFSILGALISASYALILPNVYQSRGVVTVVDDSVSGLSGLASQYSGLASIAGVDIGGGAGQNATAVAMARIKSFDFFRDYLYDDLIVNLSAVSYWDADSNQLILDPTIFDASKGKWGQNENGVSMKPTPQSAFLDYLGAISITHTKSNGFIDIVVEHQSPFVAKRWVTKIIESVGMDLRAKEIDEAQRSLDFLSGKLQETNVVALSETYSQLIEEQLKRITLAKAAENYAFDVVQQPYVRERKSAPNRKVIVIIGLITGAFLAIFLALLGIQEVIRDFLRSIWRPNTSTTGESD
jgi:capsular polysaccharide biosynthesis protein